MSEEDRTQWIRKCEADIRGAEIGCMTALRRIVAIDTIEAGMMRVVRAMRGFLLGGLKSKSSHIQ